MTDTFLSFTYACVGHVLYPLIKIKVEFARFDKSKRLNSLGTKLNARC